VLLVSCGNSIAFALALSQAPISRLRPLLSEPGVRVSRTRLSRWIMRLVLGLPCFSTVLPAMQTMVRIPTMRATDSEPCGPPFRAKWATYMLLN